MAKLSIRDLDLAGKRVLLRLDLNVPLRDGSVTDDSRIRAALPTIRHALDRGARLLLLSHLGRPKGKPDSALSLAPVAARLGELLGRPVPVARDCVGEEVAAAAARMRPGDVLMLENSRFHAGDERNDEAFSRALAALCDVYVNDAFGAAHRAHASTVGVIRFAPVAAAGFLLERELTYLGQVLETPRRPFVAILGGAKVSDKIGVIRNLLTRVDALLIGGAMAYTFLAAQGIPVGASRVEADRLEVARDILARARPGRLCLPSDHVIAERVEASAPTGVVPLRGIPAGWMGLDIGPETIAQFAEEIGRAGTIFWNGPLGVFELPPFRAGTMAVAAAVAASRATSVIGGGDTVAAVKVAGVADRMTHLSTGGGASLEFLEGKELPGIAALPEKQ
ncbi:MAG TPA: phosphoglycerate kinase [Candidatus Methylomirabilis sp.]|nr:phosphoglycerate kinase [Candidatus Methylomirabilis sp.]